MNHRNERAPEAVAIDIEKPVESVCWCTSDTHVVAARIIGLVTEIESGGVCVIAVGWGTCVAFTSRAHLVPLAEKAIASLRTVLRIDTSLIDTTVVRACVVVITV
jgi:hypothetical protein